MLPFLFGDKLVVRVDLKADRKRRLLHVLSAIEEPGIDRSKVAGALASELVVLAHWVGLQEISVSDRGTLAAPLRTAILSNENRSILG